MFGLTTLRQQPALQGARAVELVMQQLLSPRDEFPSEHFVVDVTLDVRSSTTAPPR
jgi:DNA-binding LacI/PurR family transcriptional regulator